LLDCLTGQKKKAIEQDKKQSEEWYLIHHTQARRTFQWIVELWPLQIKLPLLLWPGLQDRGSTPTKIQAPDWSKITTGTLFWMVPIGWPFGVERILEAVADWSATTQLWCVEQLK
jgi:hypothetical protein